MWELNPRGLSTTDLAGLPHTRLGESRTPSYSQSIQGYLIKVFCTQLDSLPGIRAKKQA